MASRSIRPVKTGPQNCPCSISAPNSVATLTVTWCPIPTSRSANRRPFRGATKEKNFHHLFSYPRGVTIQRPILWVVLEPINTVVNISTSVSFNACKERIRTSLPSLPTLRTHPHTVSGCFRSNRISQARRRCPLRLLEPGLYKTITLSPSAAHTSRLAIWSQGVMQI